MTQHAYLNERKVKNHGQSTAKYCIGPKLCTVAHAVMPSISCQDNTSSDGLHFFKQLGLVLLPIKKYCREELTLKNIIQITVF